MNPHTAIEIWRTYRSFPVLPSDQERLIAQIYDHLQGKPLAACPDRQINRVAQRLYTEAYSLFKGLPEERAIDHNLHLWEEARQSRRADLAELWAERISIQSDSLPDGHPLIGYVDGKLRMGER